MILLLSEFILNKDILFRIIIITNFAAYSVNMQYAHYGYVYFILIFLDPKQYWYSSKEDFNN